MIDCAKIPTEASKLVKAEVLKNDNTKCIFRDEVEDPPKILNSFRFDNGDDYSLCKADLPLSSSQDMQQIVEEGRASLVDVGEVNCDNTKLGFYKSANWSSQFGPTDKDIENLKEIASLLNSGIPEVAMSIHSQIPVIITGNPGYGKSVRMKQICSEITVNRNIRQVPVFLKAKHLADLIYRHCNTYDSFAEEISPELLPDDEFMLFFDGTDYKDSATLISMAFLESNPDAGKFGLDQDAVFKDLLEIQSNSDRNHDSGIVLIIDAIDEIEEKRKADVLIEWVHLFSESFGGGNCRFVLSTRPSHLHHVSEYFGEYSICNMHFERETLQHDFPQKLVDAWTMGGDVANRARDLISDDDIFKHIDRPLLIGWLCRFIRDGEKDLGDLKEKYSFFGKILDYAIKNKRFETENKTSFTETKINSIKRMRDCIAFIDLLRLGNSEDVLRLNSKENRLNLLKIRHTGFFPGLDDLSGGQAHKLFFEDMSLIFVSGSGDVEWTHDHLREYAAALFYTLEDIRLGDMIEIIKSTNYGIISKNLDLDEFVSQEIMPKRPYFRQAYQSLTGYVTETTSNEISIKRLGFREPRSTIKNQNGEFKLNEIEYRIEFLSTRIDNKRKIEPSEYVDLMTDIALNSGALEDNVNQVRVENFNKENLINITKFFISKNISWLFPELESTSNQLDGKKSYPELFTGGIIPRLSQKLLTEDERELLFKEIAEPKWNSQEFDEENLKLMFFNHFMKSSDKYDFIKYKTIWRKNYRPTQTKLDSNKLLIKPKFIQRYKKLYTDEKNSTKFFNYFQEFVQEKNLLGLVTGI